MKPKKTQLDWVVAQLKRNGKISRNECLRNYLSRLSAYILDLKNEGWKFKAGYTENGDYLYVVVKK